MHSLKQFAISALANALTEKNSNKKFNLHEKEEALYLQLSVE